MDLQKIRKKWDLEKKDRKAKCKSKRSANEVYKKDKAVEKWHASTDKGTRTPNLDSKNEKQSKKQIADFKKSLKESLNENALESAKAKKLYKDMLRHFHADTGTGDNFKLRMVMNAGRKNDKAVLDLYDEYKDDMTGDEIGDVLTGKKKYSCKTKSLKK